ncbi:winged helix-turn-helix domain-containing protein [Primorskyibacter sp. S87]|uniref:winged helix-turn-helix domain-containing protein n=1 Tax=Primorskyibacter sp. S87 TaxID=3415126 RepID=UPI003C7BDAC7
MALPVLENRDARRLFLHRHLLAEPPVGSGKGADLASVIHRLGFVQLDSINTVARSHDMILFSRRPRYRPAHLKQLYEQERALFEHWTHDAAVIPIEFFPHWHLRFQRDAEMLRKRWRNWRRDGYEARFETVLQHIRDNGPVCSSDVGKDEKKGSGGWWDWHPSKTALEYLWRSGALSVTGRDRFQKRYDLTERVIEEELCPAAGSPDPELSIDWLCNAALDRLGFATSGEISAFWDTVNSSEAKEWCHRSLRNKSIIEIEVTAHNGSKRRAFARPNVFSNLEEAPEPPKRLRILSPFDPALRDRKRAERLFGFYYRIEVFVPEPKRVYGYYVFPMLEGDRLAGRIDMKAFRNEGILRIRAVWPESSVRWTKTRQARFEAELERVRRFTGLDKVEFEAGWLRQPAD